MNTSARARRWTVGAAMIYVLAWLTGLLAAPAAPGSAAGADQIHAHYLEHGAQVLTQALLVHGAAGLALAVMALGTTRLSRAPKALRAGAAASGLGAAAVSLAQVGIAVAATQNASTSTGQQSLTLFHAINYADSIKIVLLAVFVITATRSALNPTRPAARWLRILALLLAPLLLAGAAAFLLPGTAVLDTLLAISLIMLLIWAAGIAWNLKAPSPTFAPAG